MQVRTKIISVMAIGALMVSTMLSPRVTQAATDTLTQFNENTGVNSLNHNRARIRRAGQQTVLKNAVANTVAAVNTNTGVNQSNANTQGGGVLSGVVSVAGNLNNALNQQAGAGCPAVPVGVTDIALGNMNTGASSTNTNDSSIQESGGCDVQSNATANTTLVINNNTGNNDSSGNATGGGVTSGNVNATLNINNVLN